MSEHGQELPAALLAARSLAVRKTRALSASPESFAASLAEVCAPVLASVRRSMGDDGCIALLGRAYARIEWEHPAARTIRGPTDLRIPLENLSAAIEVHGAHATAAAVEALLAALHEILVRIIGEDMAKRIIDHDGPRSLNGDDPAAS